ncbi:hypothetical protein BKA80DRAFT_298330 [Phyllosticta citrichinensis]
MADELQQHAPGGHYSGNNRIPTVRKFIDALDKDKAERDRAIDERGQPVTDGTTPHPGNQTHKKENQKTVTDPTTGREVVIENADKHMIDLVENPQLSVPNANLGKDSPIKTDSSQPYDQYKENQDVTAPPDPVAEGTTSDVPIHGEKTNILFHPTPSVSYEPYFVTIEKQAGGVCAGVVIAIVMIGKMFGGSLWGLIPLGACVASGVWLWMKEVVRRGRELEWHSERTRGQTSVADTIEDVMQASVPGVIENVRVSEINQGSNPIRILSMRALPDSQMNDMKKAIHEENKKTKDPQEAAADEEGGDYYNLEVSFAYHAKPSGGSAAEKAKNMHMALTFYLGVKGLFGVPLPIFVELQGLVGTVRLRLNMTPEPPYLKTLTFSLMGLPHIEAGCIPMMQKGINILNLPLISNFVNYAIGAAASMYVAPKSMSLDLRAILQGDDITKDVHALGILWIRIHRATGLSKQDKRGSSHGGSDPYITLTFSKYGKPMYCTRVITDDLNPIWEETAALLVTPELIKADENLSVELWDSDRHSADDIVGKVELSMQKMIQHPGKMYPQVSKLAGMDADSSMPGELHWEVGYFGKPKYRPELRTDGKNKNLDANLQDNPEFQDEKGVTNTEEDDAVQHTPPDPLWPTGIVSVVVHQIVNLELDNVKGTAGSRKGREFEPAKAYGENSKQEGGDLPNSYCTILLNDELVYRTRSKAVSSQPIFNAGTERFIRDWRSGIVTVTVRDQRHREHDPILGVVPLKLTDILESSSQVTRWYPLDGGIGFGRIRISLLFRSVETRLPPNLLGWDVGTFEFCSDRITAHGYQHHAKLRMRTGGSTAKVPRTGAHQLEDGDGVYWDVAQKDGQSEVRLPVKYRYRSPVVFEFHVSGKRKPDAHAVVWLQHLIDNENTEIDIPIWQCMNPARLTLNYITEDNCKGEPGLEDLKEVGRLRFSGRFKAGMDESHEAFIMDNDSRETYETWEACIAEGVRQRRVDKELPERIQQLHERSLSNGRDILKAATEEEKRKWLSRDGANWSGAFGSDPKAFMDSKGRKRREPGKEAPLHDPNHPSSDEDHESDFDDEDRPSSSSTEPDLGMQDADNMPKQNGHRRDTSSTSNAASTNASTTDGRPSTTYTSTTDVNSSSPTSSMATNNASTASVNRQNRRTEARKQRGLMQWRPARNVKFAKDESIIGMRKLKNMVTGQLDGRKPGVETETGN